jgi:hypothetical protein
MRARVVSRLVSLLVAGALVLSLAAPARAQVDPMTLSLIISGAQLLLGAVTSLVVAGSYEAEKKRGPVPMGLPCGAVDGVPQMCWQNSSGGYEGTDVLPYSAPASITPQFSLELVVQEAPPVGRPASPSATPGQ